MKKVSSFRIIDIEHIKSLHENQIDAYGSEEIHAIRRKLDEVFKKEMDKNSLQKEWLSFKNLIKNSLRGFASTEIYAYMLRNSNDFPNMAIIIQYYLMLPTSTVECDEFFLE